MHQSSDSIKATTTCEYNRDQQRTTFNFKFTKKEKKQWKQNKTTNDISEISYFKSVFCTSIR